MLRFHSLLFVAVVFAADTSEKPPSNLKIIKNEKDFDSAVEKYERALVFFFAEDCSFCKSLKPVILGAANALLEEDLKTAILEVYVDDWKNGAITRFGFEGFPATHYYVNKELKKSYQGVRFFMDDHLALVNWIRRRETAITGITYTEESVLMIGYKKHEVPLLAAVKNGSVRQKVYHRAVEVLANIDAVDFVFGQKSIKEGGDPKADASLRMGGDHDGEESVDGLDFKGNWTEKSIINWALDLCYARVGHHWLERQYSALGLSEMGHKAAVTAILSEKTIRSKALHHEHKNQEKLKEKYTDIDFGDKVKQIFMNLRHDYPKWRFTMDEFQELSDAQKNTLGVSKPFEPQIHVCMDDNTKYTLEGEDEIQDADTVAEFFVNITSGKQRPAYKSQPVPENPIDADGSVTLVGKTFRKVALDPMKDVFVFFWTRLCTTKNCDTAKRLWQELVAMGKKRKWSVTFAKIDSQSNDCEDNHKNAPAFVLYPAVKEEKKLTQRRVYRGELDMTLIADFISENAAFPQDSDEL